MTAQLKLWRSPADMPSMIPAMHRTALRTALATLALTTTAFVGQALGASTKFPVPSCKWVSSSLVGRTFKDPVRALKPAWSTNIAPVLTCRFVERKPDVQLGNVSLVTVQFRELQRFKKARVGWTPLPHLGTCIKHVSCGPQNYAAFADVLHAEERGGSPYSIAPPAIASPYSVPFVDGVGMWAEDGENAVVVLVTNPLGPLPVNNEELVTEGLVRKLLPKFRWG